LVRGRGRASGRGLICSRRCLIGRDIHIDVDVTAAGEIVAEYHD
jgi:hypothetical protein